MLLDTPAPPPTRLQLTIGWLAASLLYTSRAQIAAGALAEFLKALGEDPCAGAILPRRDVLLLHRLTERGHSSLPPALVSQAQAFVERWRHHHPDEWAV